MSSISNFFRPLVTVIHGKSPSSIDLLLVHGLGLSFASALLLAHGSALTLLQALILFELAWDLVGGMVANATRSTNDWYANLPRWMRITFVAIHIFHPLLAMWAFPAANPFMFIGLYFFMLIGAMPVLQINAPSVQKPAAMALLAAGFLLFSLIPVGEPALAWFAPVYLTKLIYSFSVDHYAHE